MLDFDPSYSTPRIEAIGRFIDKHYALAGPVHCRMLHRGLNDLYLVTNGAGERYVFRLSHHRSRGRADVNTETAFLTHLQRAGVPAAVPIPTQDGALFLPGCTPEGTREAVLFREISGREPSATDAGDARANGKTLALLHNAAQTFSSEGAVYRLDLEHLLYRPHARIRDSGVVEDADVLRDLETIATRTAKAIEASENLTWIYCHGDCHGFNARIDAAGDAVFFDFDDGGPGYLAYDLSVFLWAKVSFGRTLTPMWTAFIDGYRAIRPITPHDFEAALRFVIVRHFWLMGEYASRTNEWGSDAVSWIGRQAAFLKTWEADLFVDRLF
ncbi:MULTISPECIES: phosphotransferase enzyme family protein [Rhizobium]|uniref:phosphotransferase enzyme family protein n=1 Tax=Rhizobium phaseoli TaxID=396 RepID=UPI000A1C1968|nr:phosphotransferase [Rhizobium phaseoli]ARM11315.1 aminoglycoside phosphotransferase protein [Rhizobium phaseoli Brasil 5]